jgi:hypothetical protein
MFTGLPGLILLFASLVTGQAHNTAPLACQAPPHHRGGHIVIGDPDPVYKDYFGAAEEVWVAVAPNGGKVMPVYKMARIYIVHHQPESKWVEGKPLCDVSGGYETVAVRADCGRLSYTLAWSRPTVREDGYDVVVDFPPLGYYTVGLDIVDGLEDRGFFVPELWVLLESISFSHHPFDNSADALDIRLNYDEAVRVPEWQRGEPAFPAAYIGSIKITVKAVFSAADSVKSATITAYTRTGNLGSLERRRLSFRNGHSGPVYFQVSGRTPESIRSFYQAWDWHIQEVNQRKIPDTDTYIGRSTNRIYVVLREPQPPWTKGGHTAPWAEALHLACGWAEKETTVEGAAAKISRHLYHGLGGSYSRTPQYVDVNCLRLTKLLANIPGIGSVNCKDMAQSLVTFANVIGGNLAYSFCDRFGRLNCVKLIGRDCSCQEKFDDHAFASLGDRVFDACLTVSEECRSCPDTWMTDIPWDDYIKAVIKRGQPSHPKTFPFGIR